MWHLHTGICDTVVKSYVTQVWSKTTTPTFLLGHESVLCWIWNSRHYWSKTQVSHKRSKTQVTQHGSKTQISLSSYPQLAILLLYAAFSGYLPGRPVLCLLPGFFTLVCAEKKSGSNLVSKISESLQIKLFPSMPDVLCLHQWLLRQPARRRSKVHKVKFYQIQLVLDLSWQKILYNLKCYQIQFF